MAKTSQVSRFVRVANVLTTTLLRAGVPLVGPGLIVGNYPMYLLTVRGRKSGQPRTVPLAIIEHSGMRYIGSPFGIVDWVRNLRAAGEAILTRRHRSETVTAQELPAGEAAVVIREEIENGNPFMHYYGVTADSSREELERAAVNHPLFVLQRKQQEQVEVEAFETYRIYLFSIAYRMLGSAMDAEDMVQETYIRYQAAKPETIHSLKAYLTTILTRLCMDQLDLARRKHEIYVGPWLPEPVRTTTIAEAADPEKRVEMEESISLAFLMLLEQLQPFERAVFLLREVFEYEFTEIAAMLDKSEAACRRSFSRAKAHLAAHQPRFPASAQTQQQLLIGYLQAVENGEMNTLMNLLTEEVTLWADGGGKVKQAALRPITGRDAVARFSLGTRRFWPENARVEMAEVNGEPAVIIRTGGRVFSVLSIEVEAEQIRAIRIIANPEKLTQI